MKRSGFLKVWMVPALLLGLNLTLHSQLIDYSGIPKDQIKIHLLSLLRQDAPLLTFAYDKQLNDRSLIGFELGIMYDFGAGIYRFDRHERGTTGLHIGFLFARTRPNSVIDFAKSGLRVNYRFKRFKYEDWVFRNAFQYSQYLPYNQMSHEIGVYYRISSTTLVLRPFTIELGINPGIIAQFVQSDLPEDVSVSTESRRTLSSILVFPKNDGFYLCPSIYFELNIGYVLK